MTNTVTLPSVGDSVVWTVRGEKIKAVVLAMFATTFSNPGGVRIQDDIGIKYSFHPLTWMDHVIRGSIVKVVDDGSGVTSCAGRGGGCKNNGQFDGLCFFCHTSKEVK
jgi:hypothetical protein